MRFPRLYGFSHGQPETSSDGFTLLELLVVVAIASILIGMAMPSYIAFLDREKVNGLIKEFGSSVAVSRSAAIKSGIPTVMCASRTGTTCSKDWNDGWLVFEDIDRNSVFSSDERVILRKQDIPDQAGLVVESLGGGDVNTFRFNYRGASAFALEVAASSGDHSKRIQVTRFGQVRVND